MWKLKLDENGNAVLVDGKPVFVDENGKDVTYDVNDTRATITRLNGEAMGHRQKAEAATAELKKFEGIDPDKARDALTKVQNIDDKKLVDAGQVEQVRQEAAKAVHEQYAPVVKENETLKLQLRQEKIGGRFARSKFIEDKVAIPADLVEAKFGAHFDLVDGEPVGYYDADHKQPIFSSANPGKHADVDEALEKLIDAYPRKGDILKGSGHNGTGSGPGAEGAGGKNPWKQGPTFNLSEQDKLEATNPQLAQRMKAEAGVA